MIKVIGQKLTNEGEIMSLQLGTTVHPLRVAIIGAGPAGFYATDALLKDKDIAVEIDIFDKLPAPYGLVRYGVAPDHEKIKSVTKLYQRTLAKPEVRFFGNVEFGTDLSHDELLQYYDQILYAVGAQSDRRLGIPGEDFFGSLSATEFVAWYNGHPDYCELNPDLSGDYAMVIGAGNVALDVARILIRSVDELASTDIADYALSCLAKSNIKRVDIVARRGPVQAKFTPAELKELASLDDVDIIVDPAALELDEASAENAANDKVIQRNLEQLRYFANQPRKKSPKQIHFRFLTSPIELLGTDQSVEIVRIEQNRLEVTDSGYLNAVGTGSCEAIPTDLVLRAVGYKGVALPDVPFDEHSGTIPNVAGRIHDPQTGLRVPREYVAGWAKRGPSGVIGTNKPDAVETVKQMVADINNSPPAPNREPVAIEQLLFSRGVRYIDRDEWLRIDERERDLGNQQKRPRVKMSSRNFLLEFLEYIALV